MNPQSFNTNFFPAIPHFFFLIAVSITPFLLFAQEDSLMTYDLPSAQVNALRIPTPALEQPISIALYQSSSIQATRQQFSLQEYISHLPGIFSLNANNYAQDLRIAIRGFGARSAFGIRGINIIVDGIPETTPDGQGQIDNLNLGMIDRIEVIKGPAAALYGNASGGVIHISSQENIARNFLEAGTTFGSFNMQQYQLKGGWQKNKTGLLFQGNHTSSAGYRDQSGLQNTNINLRLFQELGARSKFNLQANYTNSPIGDDPGGIDSASVNENRRQARDRNILFKTGEAIDQFKIGGRYQLQLDKKQSLEFYGFYTHRNFVGRLPFEFGGWINLNRNYLGQGGHYKIDAPIRAGKNTLQVGYALGHQSDLRQRYINDEGQQGPQTLNQLESFSNLGIYLLDHLRVKKLLLTAGARFDINRLSAEDRLTPQSSDSNRNLSAFNPSLGLNYELSHLLHLYANYRSGFETPSLSELSANPDGSPGFNPELKSQRANNYEMGFKGILWERLDFDATLFFIDSKNDLVPYELAEFPERTFYRNAGQTQRIGFEWSARYQFNAYFSLKTSYTLSNFKYEKFETPNGNRDGNLLPGLPKHLASFLMTYADPKGLNIRLQTRFIGKFFAEDANSVSVAAYQITDLSFGYHWQMEKIKLMPFFGVNNIFNVDYNDNVRLNAFGGRYFEPAAGVNIFGGLRVRFHQIP